MSLVLCFFLFFISRSTLHAVDFQLSQNITYTLDDNGRASVVHQCQLTNNFSEIYPREFRFDLSHSRLEAISGNDDFGNIVTKSDIGVSATSIYLTFNRPSVGKDKTTSFTLRYAIPEFAQIKGNTHEIIFPDYHLTPSDTINITLNIPRSFGGLAFSSISGKALAPSSSGSQLIFSTPEIKQRRVSLAFGPFQLFDFSLRYFLDNPSSETVLTEIPLPPDTPAQAIIFEKLEPRPVNIISDPDGNWLAQYHLPPHQSREIIATGQAKIFPSTNRQTTSIKISDYLQEKPYWPISHPQIQNLAATLKTPRAIFNYVVATLDYNYQGLNQATRRGAANALKSPEQSLCTEFTDLFIAIARAAGLPAREVEGFAYTNNSRLKPTNPSTDILHAWPQYYDSSRGWVDIDPTWTKTTNGIDFFNDLDLNHLTFVIHGLDSQYPPPPGSFKKSSDSKTVDVSFTTKELDPSFLPPRLQFLRRQPLLPPLLKITNPNFSSLKNLTLSDGQNRYHVGNLPPLASTEIDATPLPFFPSLLPKNQKTIFTITSDNQPQPLSVSATNYHYLFRLLIFLAVAIFILCLGGIIITSEKNTPPHRSRLFRSGHQ